ncbi:MAG: NAD(P)-dependent oxidoreductase [Sphaerochaetaceae bacterium]
MQKIGIIGSGAMGKGLAKNLYLGGYGVTAFKRVIKEEDPIIKYLRENKIEITDNLDLLFKQSDIIITCLPDSPTVESILVGEKGLFNIKESSVKLVIDFSTALPSSTKMIAKKLKEKNIEMLEAPMTGGPVEADKGVIRVAVGGERELFEKYKPLFEKISSLIVYGGNTGSGHTIKLLNNFLASLNIIGSSGVLILAEKLKIEQDALASFVTNSGGNSWGFNTVLTKVRDNDFKRNYFALKLAAKDMRYNKEVFEELGEFPLLDELQAVMSEALERGFGDGDVTEIFLALKEKYK